MTSRVSRRAFLDGLAVGAAGLAVGTAAKSYDQIIGSNDRLNFAVIGLNGRGRAHLSALNSNKANSRLAYFCDVDSHVLSKFAAEAKDTLGYAPIAEGDFRRQSAWKPDGAGFARVTVIDAQGAADSARIRID